MTYKSAEGEFKILEENIETTIYEGLLKLGYQENDSLSIYYDLDLLNHLLNTTYFSNEECYEHLKNFKTSDITGFHTIDILLEKNRFKFTIYKEGMKYIYTHNDHNSFLKELINTVKTHSFTIQDIITIFKHYSKDYICEEIENSEFQYVLYFKDATLDKFKYCFTFDQMGGYYHRLLDFNYNKIINE